MKELHNKFRLFISCLFVLLQSTAAAEIKTRIVGGSITTIDHAPFLVQIRKDGNFHCGGTLVSEFFVVTAAHCVVDMDALRFVIVGGVSRTIDIGVSSLVSNIHVPMDYSTDTQHMDVAVLKLYTPMVGPYIQPIGLCNTYSQHGDRMKLYGWGWTHERAGRTPIHLKTVTVSVIDQNTCANMYSGRRIITDPMMCALGWESNSCYGDSGGPAIVHGQFCGIVSWGIGCARHDSPAVYTDVIKATPFILWATQQ